MKVVWNNYYDCSDFIEIPDGETIYVTPPLGEYTGYSSKNIPTLYYVTEVEILAIENSELRTEKETINSQLLTANESLRVALENKTTLETEVNNLNTTKSYRFDGSETDIIIYILMLMQLFRK